MIAVCHVTLCHIIFRERYGCAPICPLHKHDHCIGVCIGVCIGYASGMHQVCVRYASCMHQVITLSVRLDKGGFGARQYVMVMLSTLYNYCIRSLLTACRKEAKATPSSHHKISLTWFVPRVGLPRNLCLIGSLTAALRCSKSWVRKDLNLVMGIGCSSPLQLAGAYRLEGAASANRLAANRFSLRALRVRRGYRELSNTQKQHQTNKLKWNSTTKQ